MAEDIGIGGAARDVIQNHVLPLLALTATSLARLAGLTHQVSFGCLRSLVEGDGEEPGEPFPGSFLVAVEQACVLVDISDKQDSDNDVVWTPNSMTIAFHFAFYQPPALAISIQGAAVGDTWKITAKTKTGFTIQLLSSAGAVITAARTFDWQAQGY